MKYDFVFTFLIDPRQYYDTTLEADLFVDMQLKGIKGFYFPTSKGYRVITYGSTRRKIERLMMDYDGKHLRILDGLTFSILSDYIAYKG